MMSRKVATLKTEIPNNINGGMITSKSYWGGSRKFGLNSIIFFVVTSALLAVLAYSSLSSTHGRTLISMAASIGSSAHQSYQSKQHVKQYSCDLSHGRWIFDDESYPLYPESKCSYMSDQLACEKYGRKDTMYQKWRWQPHACNLPRFNGTKMMESIRGRRMVFVGDSLNRNQWISMLCLLESSAYLSKSDMQSQGSLTKVFFKEYNASVEFYWSPLLVESNSDDPINHRLPDRIVRVESIEKHARHWTDADILVFNTYLWWKRSLIKVRWGPFEREDDGVVEELETVSAYKMALKAWSDWLDEHVDPSKTKIFFVTFSPKHQSAKDWGKEENCSCYGETEPINNGSEYHLGKGSSEAAADTSMNMMRAVEEAVSRLKKHKVVVGLINITQLSNYRKEGHPSIYRKQWEELKPDQLAQPTSYAELHPLVLTWCT